MISNSTRCTPADENFILKIQLYLGGWTSLFICLFGLMGTFISILVFGNTRMRTLSTNTYLLALSITNFIWLLLYIITQALRFILIIPNFIEHNDEKRVSVYNQLYDRSSPYVIPLMNTFQLCSIYYTVAASVDRYLYISCGVKSDRYCTVRTALKIIIILTLFSSLCVLPNWLKYRAIQHIDIETNRTRYKLELTQVGQHLRFRQIFHVYGYIPIVYVLPSSILIITTLLTIRKLFQFRLQRQCLINTVPNKRHSITSMLIALVLVFLLCRFPMLINHIYEQQKSITSDYDNIPQKFFLRCRIRRSFNTIVNFLQIINASGHLIIYCIFNEHFRRITKEIICLLRVKAKHKQKECIEDITYDCVHACYTKKRRTATQITTIDL
ncbi:unnamed protein product [Didymodactylos carnosus]|uniref:G-protein coupled receptors family 1 profile domain-containing protein n=1 Tax=Didymodactylos carnosus TaxID=1234261 RepID=A0A813ZA91_9BILA|nr:unnamed protein product [Didymodactylos carnosus]CAF0896536.1 unnamed protein product [Didymodactylos carnosus]CAF3500860.1 unnamed protein product [Didymodactylos carnosus]CAF3679777.1 unnamed protein product [Didymodactylos carnosus]